jgi:hypothetical protein
MNMALNGHPRSNEDEGPPDMTEDLATTNADPMSRLQQPSGRNRAGVVRYVFPVPNSIFAQPLGQDVVLLRRSLRP